MPKIKTGSFFGQKVIGLLCNSTIELQELQIILVVFSDCEFADDTLAFWTQIFVHKQRSIKSTGI